MELVTFFKIGTCNGTSYNFVPLERNLTSYIWNGTFVTTDPSLLLWKEWIFPPRPRDYKSWFESLVPSLCPLASGVQSDFRQRRWQLHSSGKSDQLRFHVRVVSLPTQVGALPDKRGANRYYPEGSVHTNTMFDGCPYKSIRQVRTKWLATIGGGQKKSVTVILIIIKELLSWVVSFSGYST